MCIIIQAGRTKAGVIEILHLLELIQGKIYVIAPAFARFTATELLTAPGAYRWFM